MLHHFQARLEPTVTEPDARATRTTVHTIVNMLPGLQLGAVQEPGERLHTGERGAQEELARVVLIVDRLGDCGPEPCRAVLDILLHTLALLGGHRLLKVVLRLTNHAQHLVTHRGFRTTDCLDFTRIQSRVELRGCRAVRWRQRTKHVRTSLLLRLVYRSDRLHEMRDEFRRSGSGRARRRNGRYRLRHSVNRDHKKSYRKRTDEPAQNVSSEATIDASRSRT